MSLSSQLLNPTACHCISQQSACETVYTFHPHCALSDSDGPPVETAARGGRHRCGGGTEEAAAAAVRVPGGGGRDGAPAAERVSLLRLLRGATRIYRYVHRPTTAALSVGGGSVGERAELGFASKRAQRWSLRENTGTTLEMVGSPVVEVSHPGGCPWSNPWGISDLGAAYLRGACGQCSVTR